MTTTNNISQNTAGCCECQACEQVCSKHAIAMVQNEEGFAYPHVNLDRCVNCGQCSKVCPMQHAEDQKNFCKAVYAAQIKEVAPLAKSSSGGMFYLISQYVFQKGGTVFGAAWDDSMKCRHTPATNNVELQKLMGSKYVHSEIGNCYKEARTLLRENRWVYFTGTPCQVAGLKTFLGKAYPTLITSDLICHGTPSQKVFDVFLHEQEQELKQHIVEYNFRDKRIKGWSCSSSSSSSIDKKGKIHYNVYNRNMQAYYNAFITGKLTRIDCYKCPFATPDRPGDITIADYWGIYKVHPEFPNPSAGTSMVIVNTDLGELVWNDIKGKTVFLCSTMDTALSTGNTNLSHSTPFPVERRTSYQKIFSNLPAYRKELLKGADSALIIRLKYLKRYVLSLFRK